MVLSLEQARQKRTGDTRFTLQQGRFLYAFELLVPGAANINNKTIRAIVPLTLNPQSITLTEPFALTQTPTVGGGLYIEEEGIIARRLSITGTTGFAPMLPPQGRKFGDPTAALALPRRFAVPTGISRGMDSKDPLSGQFQFQILQDRIFRLYSDLKQNPITSPDTYMFFHNTKDDEHYLVAPINFVMQRMAPRSTMYNYGIELLVLRDAGGLKRLSEPLPKTVKAKPLSAIQAAAKYMKGILQKVQQAAASLQKAIEDNVLGPIRGITTIISDAAAIITAAEQLVRDGVNALTSFANTILNAATSFLDAVDSIVNLVEDWGGLKPGFYNISQSYLGLEAAAERLVNSFSQIQPLTIEGTKGQQFNKNFNLGAAALENISGTSQGPFPFSSTTTAGSVPASYQAQLDEGTAPTAGADLRDEGRPRGARERLSQFKGVMSQDVLMNDSLEAIAARYLGSSNLAPLLADLNNLEPPYISRTGLPNTLKPGAKIYIPTTESRTPEGAGPTVFGAKVNDSPEEKAFGRDIRLQPTDNVVGKSEYDISIDSTGTDISFISGTDNLIQGLRTRISTEADTSVLFPTLGVEQYIGIGAQTEELSLVELSLREAILNDPRISQISNLQIQQPVADTFTVDFDASVINLQDQIQIRVSS